VSHRLRLSSARTYSRHLPFVPTEGRGSWLRERSGRWYLDCLAGAGAASLGHDSDVVRGAVARVLRSTRPLTTLDLGSPEQEAFLEALHPILPPGLASDGVVHLCAPSGTNAVEAALLVTESAGGGRTHVSFDGAFHGSSLGARLLAGQSGRPEGSSPLWVRAPYPESPDRTDDALAALEAAIDAAPGRCASIFFEGIQGEGGVRVAPPAWLRGLRVKADARSTPLVADEIQAGMCRSGRWWSFDAGGIEPDILLVSKGLGGGVPIAVLVMRSGLDRWEPGSFTGTFRGFTPAFAAAAAVLNFMAVNRLDDYVAEVGSRLKTHLEQAASYSNVVDVRGSGLMLGVEMLDIRVRAPGNGAEMSLARAVQAACFENGLIVEVGGSNDQVVRFLPPLTISSDEVDTIAERFDSALADLARMPAGEEVLS
jgi:diaminobutyrate-2-oxoglutarate transaminase